MHGKGFPVQVLEDMGIPFGVVVNRAGPSDKKVYKYCEEKNIPKGTPLQFENGGMERKV